MQIQSPVPLVPTLSGPESVPSAGARRALRSVPLQVLSELWPERLLVRLSAVMLAKVWPR